MSRQPPYFATVIPPTSLIAPLVPPRPVRELEISGGPEGLRPSITPRQQQVLYCLIEGKPTKSICRELLMSEGTAKVHIAAIFRALRVRNRTEATLAALKQGWIQPDMWSRS